MCTTKMVGHYAGKSLTVFILLIVIGSRSGLTDPYDLMRSPLSVKI
jgi:hypothetical protein